NSTTPAAVGQPHDAASASREKLAVTGGTSMHRRDSAVPLGDTSEDSAQRIDDVTVADTPSRDAVADNNLAANPLRPRQKDNAITTWYKGSQSRGWSFMAVIWLFGVGVVSARCFLQQR